jgi:hypothetical protein
MSPRALLALLALSAASSAVAVARPEATPVGSTPGPTPLGDAVRRDEAVVFASSMTAVHEEDLGWYGGEDASRSWYVRCHALASPGETRLAGTLPVVRPAAKRAVVPLGFALGTVSPKNDTVLACALFDLLPGVSRARVSRAVLPLARFADAADAVAVLSFPRGGSSFHAWVSLELRCDACVNERVVLASSKKNKKKKQTGWRDAFFAAAAILVAETCALVALAVARCRGDAHAADTSARRLRVKRKTSDAPGGGGPAVRFEAFSLLEEKTERERARREAPSSRFGRNGFEAFV